MKFIIPKQTFPLERYHTARRVLQTLLTSFQNVNISMDFIDVDFKRRRINSLNKGIRALC